MLGDRMTTGARALVLVTCSGVMSAAYFVYLTAEPFPPDIVRLIPLVWLVGALRGGVLVARALRTASNRLAAGLALVLNIPNAVFAALFSVAALMGD